ncbi:MFS transporter [Sinosporangium siamense]|uniref:Major facilitator superfamily (MFS) profile domain-containing protein n=1 Tax=Sinosporangium siamense TaxID=1367973 RepID=A0A919V6R0_9ACTN|nr:MFS transporter [Sinosporangium siamense]GII92251.1 hypothetical protein Ssi02_24820 [Sinosporangium siamense]
MRRPLVRDSLTWLLYLQLTCFALFLYGFGPSVLHLARDLGVPDVTAALHGTAFALGFLVAGVAGARLAALLGRDRLQWSALTLLSAATLLYVLGPAMPWTLTAAFLGGCAGMTVISVTTAALADHHGPRAATAISEANGMGVGVGLIAPLLVGGAALVGLDWRVGLVAVPFLVVGLRLAFRGVRLPDVRPGPVVRHSLEERGPGPGVFSAASRMPWRYWPAWAVVVTAGTIEMCMAIWVAEQLRQNTGLSRGAATMAFTLLLIGMTVGRLLGARLTQHLSADRLLMGSLLLNLGAFALLWLSTAPAPALIGVALCGLGMALQFPLAAGRAVDASAGRPDQAMARSGIGQGVASGLGPVALGVLAGSAGMRTAFLLVPALLGLAALMAAVRTR